MITFDQALNLVLDNVQELPPTELPLAELLGHFLAEPVTARIELPAFDNSAVDGFGVRVGDVEGASDAAPASLKLLGEIQAGSAKDIVIEPGAAVKILTGARVPPAVEAVVMREFCREENGRIEVFRPVQAGENVRRRGCEFAAGASALDAGVRITPPVVGLLANLGYSRFAVHKKPTVSLVVTGDELVEPGCDLKSGQIYDCNSYALDAAVKSLGLKTSAVIHAKDRRAETKKAFEQAIAAADVVISSGGVSVGDHDYVKEILAELGVRSVFWQVAIKPGKPVYFGVLASSPRRDRADTGKLIFALPGNPVSVLVTFHQFVKPALLKMMGSVARAQTQPARCRTTLRKKPGRLDMVRGISSTSPGGELQVRAAVGQDSHMLSGLAQADCLIYFGKDDELLEADSLTSIEQLNWAE